MDHPPEPRYTQAGAYAPMEAALADAVAALPDFPGFKERIWSEVPPTHDGVLVPGYTIVEITYVFSQPDSRTPLVREAYAQALRGHWSAIGWPIIRDAVSQKADRTDRSLVAVREDGIALWFWASGSVVLRAQSGPVPVSAPSEIEYVPPAGGIARGGRYDKVAKYFPDGVPADEAVDPFGSSEHYGGQL